MTAKVIVGPKQKVWTPEERHALYVRYMEMKMAEGDWHGVADCAMDLRELEAAHPKLRRET